MFRKAAARSVISWGKHLWFAAGVAVVAALATDAPVRPVLARLSLWAIGRYLIGLVSRRVGQSVPPAASWIPASVTRLTGLGPWPAARAEQG
jgi:hypothetical protein